MDGRARRYQHRRPQLLAAASEYVLEYGLGELSLRPMAQVLGVSHATLIHHFASKESLLTEIVEYLRTGLIRQADADAAQNPSGDTAELLRTFWKRLDDPAERRQFLLLAEIYGLALRDRGRYAKVLAVLAQDLRAPIETSLRGDGVAPASAAALATALLALIRGLQFDLAATGDRARVDAAFDAALDALLTTSAVRT